MMSPHVTLSAFAPGYQTGPVWLRVIVCLRLPSTEALSTLSKVYGFDSLFVAWQMSTLC